MKIALVGYDVEGQASYRYFADKAKEIVIFDEAKQPRAVTPKDIKVISGPDALDRLKQMQFDKVVRTPSLSPKKLDGVQNVTTATSEFFAHCQAPIIGVTGTKGKGTTCSLVYEILKTAGKKVWLVGNIGTPALDVLNKIQPSDIVIYELSSFQLWDLAQSPHIAVVLMIEPEHLDIHEDFDDYLKAKTNIALHQHQNDIIIFHPTNQHSQAIASRSLALNKKKYLSLEGAYINDETVVIAEQVICSISEIKLLGIHNLENVCAAVTVAWEYTKNIPAIKNGLINFKGLPHRLMFIREVNGVHYYDDSISTTPGSSIAALNTFTHPKVIILGGRSKKANFEELVQKIASTNIRKVILVGKEASTIESELKKVSFENYEHFKIMDMPKLVKRASELAQSGDVVILSPACSSLDSFKGYADRGDQFVHAVQML